jgi:transcriptional regulator with XRE-family HTH domain
MKPNRTPSEVAFARAQGRKLYDLRNARKMTRAQVHTASGINFWTLYRLEMGDTNATAFQLVALSRTFRVPCDYFFPDNFTQAPAIDATRRLCA